MMFKLLLNTWLMDLGTSNAALGLERDLMA